jgi:hypothetical protein
VLEPVLSLVKVSQSWHPQVIVAEAASALGFLRAVAGPLGQPEGLLRMRQAARMLLRKEDVPGLVEGDAELVDLPTLG